LLRNGPEDYKMDKPDYSQYFITETPRHPDHPQSRETISDIPWADSLYISDELDGRLPGAFYLETCLVLRTGSVDDLRVAHTHDFDEYLVFLGTDPEDHMELRGQVELWVGDEKRLITRSCAVFVPAGVPHCPLIIHRVDRPFVFFTTGNGSAYRRG